MRATPPETSPIASASRGPTPLERLIPSTTPSHFSTQEAESAPFAAVALWVALIAASLGACSGNSGPSTLTIAEVPQSGDLQTGAAGETLPDSLRVLVTRDGQALAADVRAGHFPGPEHCIPLDPSAEAEIRSARPQRNPEAPLRQPRLSGSVAG
jgi:hypothetical protein